MKIFNSIDSISPIAASVVTIGNFDGVHIGHQALFHTVIEKAEALSAQSIAITFEPHPIRVLKPNHHPPLITLYDQKTELIASAGIEVLICIPFTHSFAAMPADAFVQNFLVSRIGMKAIVAGRDYTFGKNREGDIAMLRQTGDQLGFETVVVDWVQLTDEQGRRISSTRIRQLVSDGQLDQAQKLLGRYYQIKGVVATGRNRGGKLLGFPTANINLHDELCPKVGVYAVTAQCLKQTLPTLSTARRLTTTYLRLKFTLSISIKISTDMKFASILSAVCVMKSNFPASMRWQARSSRMSTLPAG